MLCVVKVLSHLCDRPFLLSILMLPANISDFLMWPWGPSSDRRSHISPNLWRVYNK